MPWTKSKESPVAETSDRAPSSTNSGRLTDYLLERFNRVAVRIKSQKPIRGNRISEQLDTLIDLRRLELLLSFEDKGELGEQMDDAALELGIELNAKQQAVLLQALVDQRGKRLNGEPIEVKESDLFTS